ncbi:MAG: tRNA-(ms[2]io[6]A)-hydroxylase [Bacteroidetes bacterium]|nr:tRNA-(ms[2]io[6]A)-hydroxylase [Bacteroidota bacterium]
MLGLKLKTDARWARLALENLPELLTDHAFCEQKAASNAISLIVLYPEKSDLVQQMSQIAQEEMLHFEQVHARILERGWTLGRERKDPYVNDLQQFIRRQAGPQVLLIDRLLFAAMIEARSCERFRLLADSLTDTALRTFYTELMASEANHYVTFLTLARQYCGREATDTRWQEWLAYETSVITRYGEQATMHG